jgi:hypothetical protein
VPRANQKFRAVRERTASPTRLAECVSRQELAELVNAYVWNRFQVKVELDANYLGKLERGVVGWPSAMYREALRAILGVSDDAVLGFVSHRRSVVRLAPVANQVAKSGPVVGGKDEAALEVVQRLRRTSLDPAALDDVRIRVDRLCTAYASEPAGQVRAQAEGWLGHLAGLRDRSLTYRQHREVLDLAGWLTLLVSCLLQDAGRGGPAEQVRRGALLLGREVGDVEVIAWGAEIKAWMALTRGDLPAVVAAADEGLAATTRHSVAVQLYAQQAKAYARLGRGADAEQALARGRDLLAGLAYPINPRNHFTVDPAKYDFYAMDCHRALGQDDLAWGHAETVLRDGVAADGTASSPMRMAEAELTQAVVLARAGDTDAALGAAGRALGRGRRSVPHLLMIGGELAEEVGKHQPDQARELTRHLAGLRAGGTSRTPAEPV